MRVPLPGLRYYRERAMLSQEQLAELAGVNRSTVLRAEAGQIAPYPDTAQDLAHALGVSLSKLATDPPREHPRPMDWRPIPAVA